MKALAVSLMLLSGTASAQAAFLEQDDTFGRLVRENQQHQRHAVEGFKQALNNLARQINTSRTIVRAVMLVNCNTIVRVTRIYGDGNVVVTTIGDIQTTDAELAEQAAMYPFMRIVSECSK